MYTFYNLLSVVIIIYIAAIITIVSSLQDKVLVIFFDIVGIIMWMIAPLLLLILLWSVADSQPAAPYLSFKGNTLPNHTYVDLREVGGPDAGRGDSVKCHTDLATCCFSDQGIHRGDWYFPSGNRLPFYGSGNIYQQRISMRVDLRRLNANSPSGIYHCDISTEAVHDDEDISVRASVYVGIYYSGGIYIHTKS